MIQQNKHTHTHTPPEPYVSDVGRGGSGVILYPLLGIRHASAMSADIRRNSKCQCRESHEQRSARKHQKLILWCEDWSCIALDRLAGDIKACSANAASPGCSRVHEAITAYYGILAQSVKALASTMALQVEAGCVSLST